LGDFIGSHIEYTPGKQRAYVLSKLINGIDYNIVYARQKTLLKVNPSQALRERFQHSMALLAQTQNIHDHGIVHGDLNMSNILIDEAQQCLTIFDFSDSSILSPQECATKERFVFENTQFLKQMLALMGSPFYYNQEAIRKKTISLKKACLLKENEDILSVVIAMHIIMQRGPLGDYNAILQLQKGIEKVLSKEEYVQFTNIKKDAYGLVSSDAVQFVKRIEAIHAEKLNKHNAQQARELQPSFDRLRAIALDDPDIISKMQREEVFLRKYFSSDYTRATRPGSKADPHTALALMQGILTKIKETPDVAVIISSKGFTPDSLEDFAQRQFARKNLTMANPAEVAKQKREMIDKILFLQQYPWFLMPQDPSEANITETFILDVVALDRGIRNCIKIELAAAAQASAAASAEPVSKGIKRKQPEEDQSLASAAAAAMELKPAAVLASPSLAAAKAESAMVDDRQIITAKRNVAPVKP
jgi:serine/threonine protein kinase